MTPLELLLTSAVSLATGVGGTVAALRKSVADASAASHAAAADVDKAEISAVVALLPLMQARITALEGAIAGERKACDDRIAALETRHAGELRTLRDRIDEMGEALGIAIADRDTEARARVDTEARLKATETELEQIRRRTSGEHDAVTVKATAVPPRGRT